MKTSEQPQNIRFLKAFDKVPDLYLILSPELVILTASDAYLKATCTVREEITGKHLFDSYPATPMAWAADAAKHLRHSLQQVLATGQPHRMDVQRSVVPITAKPGGFIEKFWQPLNTPVLDEQGQVQYIIHKVEDVTDRIKAEQESKQSRELLKTIIDSSLDMIQVFESVRNESGEIIDFRWILNNRTAEEIYGDVVGKSLLQHNPGVVEAGIFDTFKRVVDTGLPDQTERHYEYEQFDGWFYQSTVKLGDGVATTTRDITKRKRAKQELEESKNLLQTVFDVSLNPIAYHRAVRDTSGKIVDFEFQLENREARKYAVSDRTGKRYSEAYPGIKDTVVFQKYREVVDTGEKLDKEVQLSLKGNDVWFHLMGVKLGDGLVATAVDITARKKGEQEILRLKDEIAQKATDRYYSIFNAIDEGFCIYELVYNDKEEAVDLRWVEVNPAYEKQTGLKGVVGKSHSELGLATEQYWFDIYDKVAKTGEATYFENWHEPTQRWYHVFASRIGGTDLPQVAVVFEDITERRCREQQQVYLLRLNDALRTLADPLAVQQVAMQLLGEHLKVDRVVYADINIDQDYFEVIDNYANQAVQKIVGRFPFAAFGPPGEKLKNGENLVINDVSAAVDNEDEKQVYFSMDVHAVVAVPLIKNGKLVADLSVHQAIPRNWREDEIALIQETAERTWSAVERAKAEEALRRSQDRFKSIANLVPDLLWDSEPDGSTIWYNQRWLEYTGQSLEQAIGWGWVDAIHPDDREGSAKRYGEAVEDGKPLLQEHRIRRYDGEYRWFVVKALPLKDENGHVYKMYGAATDIHDRREAEEALLESKMLLSDMLEAAPVGLGLLDSNGDLVIANKELYRFLPTGKMPSTDPDTLWRWSAFNTDGSILEPHNWPGARAARGETVVPGIEMRYIGEDGTELSAQVSTVPNKDAAANIVGQVVAITDITARVKAEEALRISEAKFRRLSESGIVAVAFFDMSGPVLDANDAFLNLLGVTREDLETEKVRWDTYTPKEWMPRTLQAIEELKQTGRNKPYEKQFYHTSGELRWGIFAGATFGDGKSGVALAIDITERKKAEEALRISEEKYRSLFETIDEGFCIIELIYNEAGKAVDYTFVEVNPVFAQQTGLVHAAGKRVMEIAPATEAYWVEQYQTVAETGKPLRYENHTVHNDSWYQVSAVRLGEAGSRQVAIIFDDITERKHREISAALLDQIGKDLSELTTPDDMMRAVGIRLTEAMNLSGCVFVEVDEPKNEVTIYYGHTEGNLTLLKQTYNLDEYVTPEFIRVCRAGLPFIVSDTATDSRVDGEAYARLQLGAFVTVPYHQQGQWKNYIAALSSVARQWREDEISLLWEVVHRLFSRIERARADEALRESQAKYASLFESSPVPFMVLDPVPPHYTITAANEAYFAVTLTTPETLIGRRLFDVFPDDPSRPGQLGSEALAISLQKVLDTKHKDVMPRVRYDLVTSNGFEPHWWEAINAPILDANGNVTAIIHQVHRVTELQLAEEAERAQQDRQAFLLKLNEAMRATADAVAIEEVVCNLAMSYFDADRCFYNTVKDGNTVIRRDARREGVPPIAGTYPVSSFVLFKKIIDEGKPFVVFDANTSDKVDKNLRELCKQLQVISFINIPVVREGIVVGIFSFVQSKPRYWTVAEVQLATDIADHIWAAVERANAEEALRKSEEKYRTLFDSMDEGYCIIQLLYDDAGKAIDFCYLQVNQAFERNTGLSNAEGRTIRELAPDIEPVWIDTYDQIAKAGIPRRFEEASEALHHIFSLYAFRISDPSEHKVAVIFSDITKNRKAEEALRRSEQELQDLNLTLEQQVAERTLELQQSKQLLQTVFDTTQIQISILKAVRDEQGNILDFRIELANKELERETGRKDLVGKLYAAEYPGIRKVGLFDVMLQVMETGQSKGFEYFYSYEGFDKWYSSMFVRLHDGLVATNLDITEQKQVEEENLNLKLKQQKELLIAILEAQEEERSRISESLHNGVAQILYAAKLRVEGLTRKVPSEYDAKLDKLLQDAIHETRMASHELVPNVLREFGLEQAILEMCARFEDSSIRMEYEIEAFEMKLEPYQELALYRISQELINNIIKHSKATDAKLLLYQEDELIHLKVRDNGIGFEEKPSMHIGIGLRSIENTLKLLNGTFDFSIPSSGSGTQVTITIPIEMK